MNTIKLLLSLSIFATCTACSEQKYIVHKEAVGKQSLEYKELPVEPAGNDSLASQKEETLTENKLLSGGDFCDNKEKIDVLFWPNDSTIDKAKFVVPRPDTLVEQGVNLNERKQFERNAEQVALTADLNNDMRLDVITSGYCVGGGGCMYSIYINCGSKRFYHMHDFQPYALGIEIHGISKSGWKSVKVLSQGGDSSVLEKGQDVIYEHLNSSYQPALD